MADFTDETTRTVRTQYENYPYPERDPADERTRVRKPILATLDVMNHYCFRGRRDFGRGFRALVAGGGTGDATIWLAEQLKDTDATVVHLDISEASADVAKARAAVRGLTNITWIHGSLLEAGQMGFEPFNYINCCGVLHHLSDPPAGLAALRSVLADDGCMGIMVYAQYGRTGVYQMQDLMRRINDASDGAQQEVDNTRAVLADLPASNWFKRGEGLFTDHLGESGIGLYDLLLHSQDRAYTVDQLYDVLAGEGLNLVKFIPLARAWYRPEHFLSDARLVERIAAMPLRRRQAIGELISGEIIKHSCFVSPRTDTVADITDPRSIPVLAPQTRDGFKTILDRPRWTIEADPLPRISIKPGGFTRAAFKLIDGRRSIGEIVEQVRQQFPNGPSAEEVLAQFIPVVEALCEWADVVLLRHPDSGPTPWA